MHGFLTVHCSNCFSRASESPSAGHSSFRNTSTSAIHFFKVFTSFWGGETRTGTEIQSESLDSQTTFHNPSNPSHLKLHQFGHELLDSLGVVCQRGAKSSPACHDGVHLSAIPTENYRRFWHIFFTDALLMQIPQISPKQLDVCDKIWKNYSNIYFKSIFIPEITSHTENQVGWKDVF